MKSRLLELQNKVNELTIAQKEYEECAKKLETTTKLVQLRFIVAYDMHIILQLVIYSL